MYILPKNARAILKRDFAHLLQKCTPPGGWPTTIAVANSGGPDSTCLLFLLNQHFNDINGLSTDNEIPQSNPQYRQRVVSLTVNHDLQPLSSQMASQCARFAESLGVPHITTQIRWGEPPFPLRPSPDAPYEQKARLGRHHLLFEGMKQIGASAIAYGHHADDQVETSLMRLGAGSSVLGAAGMRGCRRMGMGLGRPGQVAWFGHEGMGKWVVRPLLEVSKDRILATCEEHGLEYVTDSTNFQPQLTVRNAIRRAIERGGWKNDVGITLETEKALASVDEAAYSVLGIDLTSGVDELRAAVSALSTRIEDIDHQVDMAFKKSRLSSPPGTLLLALRPLLNVNNDVIRTSLIYRAMRFVSFHPWGSPRSEGKRRLQSIQQIIDKVFNSDPYTSGIQPFTAGSGVLWTPVLVRTGQIKFPDGLSAAELKSRITAGASIAWLASRQPPNTTDAVQNDGSNVLHRNVTQLLLQAFTNWKAGEGESMVEILYDNRFLVRFDLELMPQAWTAGFDRDAEDMQIFILPESRFYWPIVIFNLGDQEHKLEVDIDDPAGRPKFSLSSLNGKWHNELNQLTSGRKPSWINIQWIRTLDAI